MDFDLQPNSHMQPGLPSDGLHHSAVHVITWITIHLLTQEGWMAELALLADS